MKRWHKLKAKPGELKAAWGKADRWDSPDLCYAWGGSGADKADAHLLDGIFARPRYGFKGYEDRERSFLDELKARGYDVTTLKFYVRRVK